MEWFKFYHNKWLTDRAINNLCPQDRLCFITLLCVTSQSDERDGSITNYCEHEIIKLTQLDVNVYDDDKSDYHLAIGFTERLLKAGLIEKIDETTIRLKNFKKRQETLLSPAERSKKYREKQRKVTNVTDESDERTARVEKIREDKSREDKNKPCAEEGSEAVDEVATVNEDFETFWKAYPKKKGKGLAEKSWNKQNPDLKVVLEAIAKEKLTKQWQKDKGQFIPFPATWLNQKRWQDETEVDGNNFSKYDE